MKKPVVDYREFRLSRLTDPRFSHLLLLLGWVFYFAAYFITENFIPMENCRVVHIWLDDVIPFCEAFVIPYTFWYLLIVGSLLYFALYNVESFKKLQKYIIITQVCAMIIYILFPNRQDLRPEVFPRDNILTDIVAMIYAFDTNSNVCPSLHVAYSIGIASVWLREKDAAWWVKVFVTVSVIMICLSTMFIKQHSALDAFAAIPVCLLAEWLLFYRKKRA
ncbi:MAG: phosphatidic acid phosphatase [Clostridia bacterium]|nr:phosphatidic acid phosphatase [Clostridia bacterium]